MFEAKSLTEFFRQALSLSERGTKNQTDEMAGTIADTSHLHSELADIKNGKRDPKLNPHHKPEDLIEAITNGVREIKDIAQEINSQEKLPPLKPLE